LASCTDPADPGTQASSIARAAGPLPLTEENAAITSELPIEKGATLRVYQWQDYLAKDVLESFERKYADADIRVHTESFDDVYEAMAKMSHPSSNFDVFFPSVDTLAQLTAGGALQPLNHDYLPNIANVWPALQPSQGGPVFDPGMRYTTPYTVFTTGIGWREDLVDPARAPDQLDNPYDAFWDPALRGQVGLYDNYREAIAMALLRDSQGGANINTNDGAALRRAAGSLLDATRASQPALTADGVYDGLPEGEYSLHQAWSGDMMAGVYYGRAEDRVRETTRLRYWWPTQGDGVIGVDLMAIPRQAQHPVLAHLFLNHLMDLEVALDNFAWNGYQPPLEGADRETLCTDPRWMRLVGPHLMNALAMPEDLVRGQLLLQLDPTTDALWRQNWDAFVAGAALSTSEPA